ncbi:KTSC domain-containing protein [Variovorax sp. YR266]|nr:KTSC domain-containing protein [Variovorax sp. YR266]
MQMISVNSSAMSAVGYDPERRHMRITFSQGHTYDFCGVPQHIFDGLIRAASKGSYYNDHVKDRYAC